MKYERILNRTIWAITGLFFVLAIILEFNIDKFFIKRWFEWMSGHRDFAINITLGGFASGIITGITTWATFENKKQDVKEEMSGVTETAAVHKGAEEINKGFQGVIENPYKNAKINGVQGFIKGLGSGFLETILTPLSSMLTFSKNNSTWMKNTAIKFAGGKIKTCRFRHPRVIYQNEPLTEYDANLAEVNEILHRMKKTSFNKIFLFMFIKYALISILSIYIGF